MRDLTACELLEELTSEDVLELDAMGWRVHRSGSDLAVRKTLPGGACEVGFRFLGQRLVRVQTSHAATDGAGVSDVSGQFTREFFWAVLDAAQEGTHPVQP